MGILLSEPEYIDPLGRDAPEGMLVTGYPWYGIEAPAHTAFVGRYREFVGRRYPQLSNYPYLGSLVGYITMLSLARGVEKAGSVETEAVIKAMEGLVIDTPIGPISFRPFDHQSTMGAWVGVTKFDPARALQRQTRALKALGLTIVVSEQNVRFVAPLADRAYIIEKG